MSHPNAPPQPYPLVYAEKETSANEQQKFITRQKQESVNSNYDTFFEAHSKKQIESQNMTTPDQETIINSGGSSNYKLYEAEILESMFALSTTTDFNKFGMDREDWFAGETSRNGVFVRI